MKVYDGYDAYFKAHPPQSHTTLSFHHHLRNGDAVLNDVLAYYRNHHHLTLMPSSIFPVHQKGLIPLLDDDRIEAVYCNYLSGPVAKILTHKTLPKGLHLDTHGGRARRLLEHLTPLDVAYVALPTIDHQGNLSGLEGPSACGSLGYAHADAMVAKELVLITDHYVDAIKGKHFRFDRPFSVIVVDALGVREGIESGTTQLRVHPLHDLIAKETIHLLDALECLPNRLSFQTGAGSISLRITEALKHHLVKHQKTARFASGGITEQHTRMLEEGLIDTLYDVQCFDLAAIESCRKNQRHIPISADRYANPNQANRVIKDLDLVFLGAAQVDTNFNVNVTSEFDGTLMGGSGGHADTAEDAKLTVIVSPLLKGRMPLVLDRVTTITTPGKHIDMVVTEHGFVIHPSRQDLLQKAHEKGLSPLTIDALKARAEHFAGTPEKPPKKDVVGFSYSRYNEVLDTL